MRDGMKKASMNNNRLFIFPILILFLFLERIHDFVILFFAFYLPFLSKHVTKLPVDVFFFM